MDQIASLFLYFVVIHACSVLGSILLILGLYILLWGKKRDASEASSSSSSSAAAAKEEEEDKEKQVRS
jgi:hypothetical protein